MRYYLNNDWGFVEEFEEQLFNSKYKTEHVAMVRIPHSGKELPYNYCSEESYQMVAGYRKEVWVDQEWKGKRILLTFEGVAHKATVYLNQREIAVHSCGYTAFTCDITQAVIYNESNVLVVKVDSQETLNQPPFGNVIDYMTYSGIYRDVYLDVKEVLYIEDVFVRTPKVSKDTKILEASITLNQEPESEVSIFVYLKSGSEQKLLHKNVTRAQNIEIEQEIEGVELWDIDHPVLYELLTEISIEGAKVDEKVTRFGFRTAQFTSDGFFLNGTKVKLQGVNRHQSYPYVGYAMPKSMQILDADILRRELCMNAVRTSHYPQSQYFIDRCDEIGLLVFTEIPGWQYIGDEEWKEIAIKSTEEMVKQYRNHPSIILWGVRINESQDDHKFYTRTNKVARELDGTRAIGGVRYIKKSEFLEDVYTFNDFIHEGTNAAISKKASVTSDMTKAYLISEYNGHMYPTKAFDDEKHRLEHALRHARVLDAVKSDDEVAGSFGWCMFDYNTHKDFGSGDRICYHGLLDMFRNPKQAAALYRSQGEMEPVLELSSTMDIGEYPGGVLENVYIYTNADSVRMYKNDVFIREYQREDSDFTHLAHGPIRIKDFIGNQLVEQEGYSQSIAKKIKQLMMDAMTYGLNHLPFRAKLSMINLMLLHGFTLEDGVNLYTKYVSGWGDVFKVYRFDAMNGSTVVKTVTKAAPNKLHLQIEVNRTQLKEESTYDVASIRIFARDEYDNIMCYCQEPVKLHCEGQIVLIGPEIISLKGGMGGTYVKTVGKEGGGLLTLQDHLGQEYQIRLEVSISKEDKRR